LYSFIGFIALDAVFFMICPYDINFLINNVIADPSAPAVSSNT
jgi:hypothetical protein